MGESVGVAGQPGGELVSPPLLSRTAEAGLLGRKSGFHPHRPA